MEVTGTVLAGRSFEPVEGRVVVEDGEIAAVEAAAVESDDIVVPAFVNAHTHIGDSVAKEAGEGLTMEELVAPPDGLKHRILRATDREELVAGMRRSLSFMAAQGVAAHVDFREGGVDGVSQLRAAGTGVEVESVIMARESVEAMAAADGFGASGANDADFSRERVATREAGKPFGIHAGEGDAADINAALDLDPDYLVHMVHADPVHLERVEDAAVPIVVCPRANLVAGVGLPSFSALNERTTLALGTDNVMLNSPSVFREMAVTAKLSELSTTTVLRMATRNAAEIAGLDCGLIESGRPAHLVVLDGDSDNLAGVQDPRRAVVRRAGVGDVKRVIRP
jgi:cytosine/adenosine deaminase-related metal-dependent hydrolase